MAEFDGGKKRSGRRSGKGLSQDDLAYEYLCRLEEAKKWIESVIKEDLPPVLELEDALQNGVYLCKLGMSLLPGDELWKKVYDLDQSKYKERGLDYRYTDNINFWLGSLIKLGLPKVFYPVMTDIFHKKDMPKLLYCLHALSHLMKKKGQVAKAVDDLFGAAKFSQDELVKTGHNLHSINCSDMPAFGLVENLVDEELQYLSMGLCDSFEDDTRASSLVVIKSTEEAKKIFDDPTYVTRKKLSEEIQQSVGVALMDLPCSAKNVVVTMYSYNAVRHKIVDVEVSESLEKLNEMLGQDKAGETFAALKDLTRVVEAGNTFLFQTYSEKYFHALKKEQQEGMPSNVLPVYTSMDRDLCDSLLENMSPGAYIVRSSKTVEGAFVISFRNNTGIKHWKISTKNNKFYWGSSNLFDSLDEFVEHFAEALSSATRLHIYCGRSEALQPLLLTDEHKKLMSKLHEVEQPLSYGQVSKVVREVNAVARKERKSLHMEHQTDLTPSTNENSWDDSMIVEVKKVEAEKILTSKGDMGSFLVRPSERTKGDYALAFRTRTDIRHWRIVSKDNKYVVHPRPHPYNSLQDIIMHFQEAVGQETGLSMTPLDYKPDNRPSQLPLKTKELASDGFPGITDSVNVGATLLRPTLLLSPSTNGQAVGASSSMSRLNPANLSSWSVDDVCYWLLSNGFGNFVDTFKDNEVDGECLLTLDNKLLRDDLGITALGHRSRILKRVESLKKEIHPT